MADRPTSSNLVQGRLGRLASLARAGLGTAASVALGSSSGMEQAMEKLGELRGIGTKVGQMAGLVEAHLDPEMRAKVGPALAKLRDQAASSPYADVAAIVREDLGEAPEALFLTFDTAPFASASLGQVHRAELHGGERVAVKIQHPGIDAAFRGDLENVTSLGRMATTFLMPEEQGKAFIDGVKGGFLAELDYVREAENLQVFARLLEGDADLVTPRFVPERSSRRVLTTTFLDGHVVETARTYPVETRRRQAAAIRRFVISSLADHGVLYADAHAGNFLFREDGTVGVLDFGSVFRFEDAQREAFAALRDAAARGDRDAFTVAVGRAYGVGNQTIIEHIANVQWLAFGGLIRGEVVDDAHVRRITDAAGQLKKKLFGSKFQLPPFMPFLIRTVIATNALMSSLAAPESGPLGRITPQT